MHIRVQYTYIHKYVYRILHAPVHSHTCMHIQASQALEYVTAEGLSTLQHKFPHENYLGKIVGAVCVLLGEVVCLAIHISKLQCRCLA